VVRRATAYLWQPLAQEHLRVSTRFEDNVSSGRASGGRWLPASFGQGNDRMSETVCGQVGATRMNQAGLVAEVEC